MQEDVKPLITSTEDRRAAPDTEDVLPLSSIKTEPGDEIKEFAESTMDELLGCWYGYDKTNRSENTGQLARQRGHSGDSSDPDSPKHSDGGCGWCGRTLESSPPVTSANGSFCSELCFSQSRRASFKRNKTCDWCRHVRHTVSYVDVHEGSRQLQFCSDKCLNQYKMHIFCRETQAHLELHPHPPQHSSTSSRHDDGSTLITPELWLRDCRDDRESSPAPAHCTVPSIPETPIRIANSPPRRRPLPKRNHLPTHKRRISRTSTVTSADELPIPVSTDSPQDLRVRHRDVEDVDKTKSSSSTDTENKKDNPVKPLSWCEELTKRLPPVTVLVPYPIVIPLPLPIPIPIPINQFPKPNEQTNENHSTTKPTSPLVTRSARKRKRPNDLNTKTAKKIIPV